MRNEKYQYWPKKSNCSLYIELIIATKRSKQTRIWSSRVKGLRTKTNTNKICCLSVTEFG